MKKTDQSGAGLKGKLIHPDQLATIDRFCGFALKLQDPVPYRCLQGKTILHSEKSISIFEPDTRMINKGKVGCRFAFLKISIGNAAQKSSI